AKGTDPDLKRLAMTELSHPQTNDDLIAMADRWWDVAPLQPEMSRHVIREHAVAGYKLALPAASGLARLHLERRIAEVAATEVASAQPAPVATAAGPAKPAGTAKPAGAAKLPPARPSGEKGVTAKGVEFLADKSAPLRPAGTQERSKTRQFAKQQSDDPLDPFSGRPVYFALHSHDIRYAVNAPVDIRQVYWRGASFKNMTITAVDDAGNTIRETGPFTSGDD